MFLAKFHGMKIVQMFSDNFNPLMFVNFQLP